MREPDPDRPPMLPDRPGPVPPQPEGERPHPPETSPLREDELSEWREAEPSPPWEDSEEPAPLSGETDSASPPLPSESALAPAELVAAPLLPSRPPSPLGHAGPAAPPLPAAQEEPAPLSDEVGAEAAPPLPPLPASPPPDSAWERRGELIVLDEGGLPLTRPSESAQGLAIADSYSQQGLRALQSLNAHFANPDISQIHLNGPHQAFCLMDEQRLPLDLSFPSLEEYHRAVNDLLLQAGHAKGVREVGADECLQLQLPDGSSLSVILPPLSEQVQVSVRRTRARAWDLQSLEREGVLNPPMRELLFQAIAVRASVLVCGPSGSGSSTVLGMLTQLIPSSERLVVIEQLQELLIVHPDMSRLYLSGRDGLRRALHSALTLAPDRLIVGEASGTGTSLLLRASASSQPGSLMAVRCANPQDGLEVLRDSVMMEHSHLPAELAGRLVGRGVDLMLALNQHNSRHRVSMLGEVLSGEKGFQLNPLWSYQPERGEHLQLGEPEREGPLQARALACGLSFLPSPPSSPEGGEPGETKYQASHADEWHA